MTAGFFKLRVSRDVLEPEDEAGMLADSLTGLGAVSVVPSILRVSSLFDRGTAVVSRTATPSRAAFSDSLTPGPASEGLPITRGRGPRAIDSSTRPVTPRTPSSLKVLVGTGATVGLAAVETAAFAIFGMF
jgi:hypothetical protein